MASVNLPRRVHFRTARQSSYLISNSLPCNSCKDRYSSTERDSVLVEAVCECGNLECPVQSCHELSNHAGSDKTWHILTSVRRAVIKASMPPSSC